MKQSNHFGFFSTFGNDPMHNYFSSLMSTTSPGHMNRGEMKGMGTYMYADNIRRSVSLFAIRSLVKSTWMNSNDVYIGKVENETK